MYAIVNNVPTAASRLTIYSSLLLAYSNCANKVPNKNRYILVPLKLLYALVQHRGQGQL